eukprot:5436361-Lingulodinium_polyedra.AAC.1
MHILLGHASDPLEPPGPLPGAVGDVEDQTGQEDGPPHARAAKGPLDIVPFPVVNVTKPEDPCFEVVEE